MDLGAAVLRLADVAGLAEAPELRGVRAPDAVDVACRQSGRPREADVERVQVGALAAEVARIQHALHVTDAAPSDLGITERIVDDPLVDRARPSQIGRV